MRITEDTRRGEAARRYRDLLLSLYKEDRVLFWRGFFNEAALVFGSTFAAMRANPNALTWDRVVIREAD